MGSLTTTIFMNLLRSMNTFQQFLKIILALILLTSSNSSKKSMMTFTRIMRTGTGINTTITSGIGTALMTPLINIVDLLFPANYGLSKTLSVMHLLKITH